MPELFLSTAGDELRTAMEAESASISAPNGAPDEPARCVLKARNLPRRLTADKKQHVVACRRRQSRDAARLLRVP